MGSVAHSIERRRVLTGAGAALLVGVLDGCGVPVPATRVAMPTGRLQLPPLRADIDRITAITVCTRPFRPEGPRLDVERLGDQTIVHNYGHGGSGWSLSWGSSSIATDKALATGEREIAVLGCGALGLTSALLLQRAGARVTIYAKELPPNVRSSLATGVWSPDSRICLEQHATPAFKRLWESMARRSWQTYQTLLGLPGEPVEYIDEYFVSDAGASAPDRDSLVDGRPRFAKLESELLGDLGPRPKDFPPGSHPFGARTVRGTSWMMFNISAYARMLVSDFLASGGKIEVVEFHSPADLGALHQKTIINATGYGARALFGDQSVVPVRGQLARMIPQPDIRYGLIYQNVSFVPRRDGLVFQVIGENDYYGFGDDTTVPDRAEAERAVRTIASLYA
jgi:glycine/D-amino acid oxidase-like deaminating enzyme